MKELIRDYNKRKKIIRGRLKDFKEVWKRPDKKIFEELCFCICTPQSKAVNCDKAITSLAKSGMLFEGNINEIRAGLKAVRFPNNKSRFILEARKLFTEGGSIKIKNKINEKDIPATRYWFVRNVKGLGPKEASHFLRNIGLGKDIAILDVHILRNMVKYKVIKEHPKTLTEKKYILLEKKLKVFAEKINIPMDGLDLLFWSRETGSILK